MKLLFHSQTPTVAPLKFGNNGYAYLSMLSLKVIHINKMGLGRLFMGMAM